MEDNSLDVVDELLENALTDVEDSEAQNKLKTARQLVQEVQEVQQRHDDFDETVETVVSDHDLRRNLRALGYLD